MNAEHAATIARALENIRPYCDPRRSGAAEPDPQGLEYAEWLMHPTRPSAALHYLRSVNKGIRTSTCGILVRRYYVLLGITLGYITGDYLRRAGMAIIDVREVAEHYGAWIGKGHPEWQTFPGMGDILAMNVGNPHVEIVAGADAPTGAYIAYAGGQVDNTYTAVRKRLVTVPDTRVVLIDTADGNTTTVGKQHELYGRVDVQRLLEGMAA